MRHLLTRSGGVPLLAVVLALAGLTASCGGGGFAAPPMILVEFLYVDRSLVPTAPTGTENLPRNAQLLLVFSGRVDPATVNDQTIQVRFGPSGQSVPKGSFSVDENRVRFDPTVTAQGQPNPFGFAPVTQYLVDVPNFEEQPAVVRNLSDDPNLVTFFTTFTTSDGYLRELEPPEVLRVYPIPDQDLSLVGWPANGLLAIEFSEPMDPATFILAPPGGPDDNTGVDVRYDPLSAANPVGIAGEPITGTFTFDAGATTYFFKPTFSFGTAKYDFFIQVFQPLKDLSGNSLVNPRGFGLYTNDGTGILDGRELRETFVDTSNRDLGESDPLVEWGDPEEGTLRGAPIDTRDASIYGYTFEGTGPNDYGRYVALVDPLTGKALNQFVSNINPPTADGRRVMLSFDDVEMGASGSVTGASWGPDSNATFAAIYPGIILRCGYKKDTTSLSLAPKFSGNYDGNPTVLYKGSYQVPQQQNVGNTVSPTCPANVPNGNFGTCNGATHNCPLWDFTGFQAWPEFNTFFEWTDDDPAEGSHMFLFDMSVEEGDTWQQLRGWANETFPCSGFPITGLPLRRLRGVYEGDDANPGTSTITPNPGAEVVDTSFQLTKRISLAQCLFYTNDATSPVRTFGDDSDYLDVQLVPAVQSNGAQLRIEFFGAQAVEASRDDFVNLGPDSFVDWTENVHDCDGFACIRWRISLISNLISNERAKLFSVNVPVVDADPTN